MSLELTARLTLSSCVSQLTDFYSTDIAPTLVDRGLETIIVHLIDETGVEYPFHIRLSPDTRGNAMDGRKKLEASVRLTDLKHLEPYGRYLFTTAIALEGKMRWSDLYKCALHVCGDYIKFYTKAGN